MNFVIVNSQFLMVLKVSCLRVAVFVLLDKCRNLFYNQYSMSSVRLKYVLSKFGIRQGFPSKAFNAAFPSPNSNYKRRDGECAEKNKKIFQRAW
jgi:hypothetical protein